MASHKYLLLLILFLFMGMAPGLALHTVSDSTKVNIDKYKKAYSSSFLGLFRKSNSLGGWRDSSKKQLPKQQLPGFKPEGIQWKSFIPQFHGSGFVDVRYSNWKDTFTQLPSTYMRVGLSPTFTIKNIPIRSNIYYTTEKALTGNYLKNINFSLDLPKLQEQVQREITARRQAMQGELNADRYQSQFEKKFNNPLKWPDVSDIKRKSPQDLISLLDYTDYLNSLPEARYKRMRDSIHIYDPAALKRLDSMRCLSKLVKLPQDSFKLATDTLKGKYDALLAKAKQVRRLKAMLDYRPRNLTGKGDSLLKQGLVTKAQALMLNFKKLGVGDVYPQYSPFILDGLRVRGGEVLYTPGSLIAGAVGGQATQVQYNNGFALPEIVHKNVGGGVLGFSNSRFTLKAGFAQFWNNQNVNVPEKTIFTRDQFTRNQAGSALAGLKFRGLVLEAEGAVTRSYFAPGGLLISPDKGLVLTNVPVTDMAYRLKAVYQLAKTRTRFSVETKRIGPDFYSFGVPYLRNDLQQQRAEVEQALWGRTLVLNGFIMQERDNLRQLRPATDRLTSPGGSLSFQLPRLPYIIASYLPFDQKIQSDSFFFRSRYSTISLQSGYQYLFSGNVLVTSINAIEQREYFSAELAPGYNRSIFLSQVFQTRKAFSFTGSIGWVHSGFQKDTLNMLSYDMHVSDKITDKIKLDASYTRGSSFYQFIRKTFGLQTSWDVTPKNRLILSAAYNAMYNKESSSTTGYWDMHVKYQIMW